MRREELRLINPAHAHQRIAREAFGIKNPREVDDDAVASQDGSRLPASDRPRITGTHSDGSAFRDLLSALERLGIITDQTDIDPELAYAPYENNAGLRYRGVKPTIAAGAAAGTTPTLSISEGTDHAGRITLVCGTAPPAGGIIATITFNVPLPVASYVVQITAADPDAAAGAGATAYSSFVTQTTTEWELLCTAALTAGVSYHWVYHVVEFDEV